MVAVAPRYAVSAILADENDALGEASDVVLDAPSKPEDWSAVADALDLHGAPLQENRRANPPNTPGLGGVSGNVGLKDADAKEFGHDVRPIERRSGPAQGKELG